MMSTDNMVAQKVLKRAEISRITRTLKSRLALASFKTKRGWQDMNFDSIEKQELPPTKKQRRRSGMIDRESVLRQVHSSPIKPPTPQNNKTKKRPFNDAFPDTYMTLTPNTVIKRPRYTQSSPTRATVAPPSTPPPPSKSDQQQGVDLLMYLATSPSPAKPVRTPQLLASSPPPPPPSYKTPPRQQHHYSSASKFTTPNGFNLNDYLNITTPSPKSRFNTPKSNAGSAAAAAAAVAAANVGLGLGPSSSGGPSRLLFPTTPEQKIHLPPPGSIPFTTGTQTHTQRFY